MKKIALLIVLLLAGTAAAQAGAYWVQFTKLETNLHSTLLDYNTLGKERFVTRLVANCKNGTYTLDPKDVKIVEDRDHDRVEVSIVYRETMKILLFPIEPNLVAKGELTVYGM